MCGLSSDSTWTWTWRQRLRGDSDISGVVARNDRLQNPIAQRNTNAIDIWVRVRAHPGNVGTIDSDGYGFDVCAKYRDRGAVWMRLDLGDAHLVS